jgi:hemerythrin-like domain-containing protein
MAPTRRAALAGSALVLAGCAREDHEGEVTATEDLMREHGVLRRLLVIYRESARMLRANAAAFDAAALGQAGALFRTFGEDYHERELEEAHIFPAVRRGGGAAAALVPVLLAQHERGRAITAFIEATCAGRGFAAAAAPLETALEAFARMYEAHTAFEDTIVFQAWKKSLSERALHEAGERFEAIEQARFHGDGFDMAVDKVAAIERRLGLADLTLYTAPAPREVRQIP